MNAITEGTKHLLDGMGDTNAAEWVMRVIEWMKEVNATEFKVTLEDTEMFEGKNVVFKVMIEEGEEDEEVS